MRAAAWVLAVCAPAWLACRSEPVCVSSEACSQAEPVAGSPNEGSSAAGAAPEPPGGAPSVSGEGGAVSAGGAGGAESEPGAGAGAAGAPESSAGAGGGCDASPVRVGAVESDALGEVSGIVASRKNPGVYYVHNDSGDSARFFAIDEQGRTLAELALQGATAVDWEDIALGPGPAGESFVYLGDIGDNEARVGGTPRPSIDVYRVPEPLIRSGEEPAQLALTAWDRLPLSYPGVAHDCEALLLDADRSELLLVTKENDGRSFVFRASALAPAGAAQQLELVTRLAFGTAEAPGSSLVTGGELSPSGGGLLLRTYTSVFFWPRVQDASIAEVFSAAPQQLPAPEEAQGEAITFSADGLSYVTVSENEHADIFRAHLCDF
jgi:hypothetical protein